MLCSQRTFVWRTSDLSGFAIAHILVGLDLGHRTKADVANVPNLSKC